MNIDNIIEITTKFYTYTFKEPVENVNILCTNNLINDIDLFIESNNPKPTDTNGLFIEPNSISSMSTILINYQQFLRRYPDSAIATILHELTHFSDYQKFVKEYCNNDWLIVRRHMLFPAFYYWSEYHARITEIIYMRILLSIIDNTYEYDEENISIEMLEYQIPRYNQEIEALNKNDNITLGDIVIYCARFYVCKLYIHDIFLDKYIPPELLKYSFNTIDLYHFLELLQSYDVATNYFIELKKIILDY